MSSSNEEKNDLFQTYDRLMQLVLNEDRLAVERTNIFLLANSFLAGAFAFLLTEPLHCGIYYGLAGIGMIFCILHFISINFTWHTHYYLRDFIINEIEGNKAMSNLTEKGLDIYTKREDHWKSISLLRSLNWLNLWPPEISRYWLPPLFLCMWILLLLLGVVWG